MNRKLLLIPLAAGISLAGLALAQSAPEGIDLEAIRARSGEHTKDADALASTVRSRAEAAHEEALQCQRAEQAAATRFRSEEHTPELQSLLRRSYAVFCVKITTQEENINTRNTRLNQT